SPPPGCHNAHAAIAGDRRHTRRRPYGPLAAVRPATPAPGRLRRGRETPGRQRHGQRPVERRAAATGGDRRRVRAPRHGCARRSPPSPPPPPPSRAPATPTPALAAVEAVALAVVGVGGDAVGAEARLGRGGPAARAPTGHGVGASPLGAVSGGARVLTSCRGS